MAGNSSKPTTVTIGQKAPYDKKYDRYLTAGTNNDVSLAEIKQAGSKIDDTQLWLKHDVAGESFFLESKSKPKQRLTAIAGLRIVLGGPNEPGEKLKEEKPAKPQEKAKTHRNKPKLPEDDGFRRISSKKHDNLSLVSTMSSTVQLSENHANHDQMSLWKIVPYTEGQVAIGAYISPRSGEKLEGNDDQAGTSAETQEAKGAALR